MTDRAAVDYVEIDLDVCSLSYGVAPCTASGPVKCFNTKKTCQDRLNYATSTVPLRFSGQGAHYDHAGIEAIASIERVDFSPAIISLGEDLGQRASLSVTFRDHPWSDTGAGGDPYWAERGYDPFTRGTFWGKFRARQPFMRGVVLRWYSGFAGQTLDHMEKRTFVIESFTGPTPDGRFTLTAKDPLKMLDGDRAQAPKLSNGFLNADVDEDDTTIVLSPSGIGNLEYPAANFFVAIGGAEIVKVTSRSGDTLTVERAQKNTEAKAHKAQDRAQLCLDIVAQPPSAILELLCGTYAAVPAEWMPVEAWEAEETAKLGQVYSRCIAEPTPVGKLVASVIRVAGGLFYWDDLSEKLRFRVLGQIATDAETFDPSNVLKDTLSIREQPNLRVSQVWTYFAQINPLKKEDDTDNYRSTAVMVDLERESDYGLPAIKKMFAPWIADFGRASAMRVSALQIGRFRDPPRLIGFALHRGEGAPPEAAGGYRIEAQAMQDATGGSENVPIQITRLKVEKDRYSCEAFEMLWHQMDDFDPSARVIYIDGNRLNVNLRDAYNQLYPAPDSETVVDVYIEAGVIVGSVSIDLPALVVGDWPVGCTINLYVRGRVQGRGGDGVDNTPTADGGPAFYTRFPIILDLSEGAGEIWSGGGGGRVVRYGDQNPEVANGSGGQGYLGGRGATYGHYPGLDGGPEAPGGQSRPGPAYARTAGAPAGQDHPWANAARGGYAGTAIDGLSFVTKIGAGDIRGPQIN